MSEKVRVRPGGADTIVRDEHTRTPIQAGQEVLRTRFIERRLRDGDLVEDVPTDAPSPPPTRPTRRMVRFEQPGDRPFAEPPAPDVYDSDAPKRGDQ